VDTMAFPVPPPEKSRERLLSREELVWIPVGSSHRVPGVLIGSTASTREDVTIIYSHGNAEDVGLALPYLDMMARITGADVFAYEYLGYGLATGVPSAFEWLLRSGKDPRKIVAFGRSLGSAPTCYLAARHAGLLGVVLQSPLESGARAVMGNFVSSVGYALDIFKNYEKVPQILCPVFIMHGTHDDVVPVNNGRQLHRALRQPYPPFWVEGRGHNDMPDDECLARVRDFVIDAQRWEGPEITSDNDASVSYDSIPLPMPTSDFHSPAQSGTRGKFSEIASVPEEEPGFIGLAMFESSKEKRDSSLQPARARDGSATRSIWTKLSPQSLDTAHGGVEKPHAASLNEWPGRSASRGDVHGRAGTRLSSSLNQRPQAEEDRRGGLRQSWGRQAGSPAGSRASPPRDGGPLGWTSSPKASGPAVQRPAARGQVEAASATKIRSVHPRSPDGLADGSPSAQGSRPHDGWRKTDRIMTSTRVGRSPLPVQVTRNERAAPASSDEVRTEPNRRPAADIKGGLLFRPAGRPEPNSLDPARTGGRRTLGATVSGGQDRPKQPPSPLTSRGPVGAPPRNPRVYSLDSFGRPSSACLPSSHSRSAQDSELLEEHYSASAAARSMEKPAQDGSRSEMCQSLPRGASPMARTHPVRPRDGPEAGAVVGSSIDQLGMHAAGKNVPDPLPQRSPNTDRGPYSAQAGRCPAAVATTGKGRPVQRLRPQPSQQAPQRSPTLAQHRPPLVTSGVPRPVVQVNGRR